MDSFVTIYSVDFSTCFCINFNVQNYEKFGEYLQMDEFYFIDHKDCSFGLISFGNAIIKSNYGCYWKSIHGQDDMKSCQESELHEEVRLFNYKKEFNNLLK